MLLIGRVSTLWRHRTKFNDVVAKLLGHIVAWLSVACSHPVCEHSRRRGENQPG